MKFDRRSLLVAGAGALVAGCDSGGSPSEKPRPLRFSERADVVPLKLSQDRLMRITVCTRPFRGAGPRLEAEVIDGKRVVHNYGHGGSGWSLSWGCAAEAVELALQGGARSFAVIGAGAMGLTTALRLVETGAQVTIYAREFPAETRSARATGVWSPSSRIGLGDRVDPDFATRWERWARLSYPVHQHYVGTVGNPVEYVRRYGLRDTEERVQREASRDFLELGRRLRDLHSPFVNLAAEDHPFPVPHVRGGQLMTFNVAAYSDRLMRDFLLFGGRMIRREFPAIADILALPEPVVVNCTGYGAKTLWGDQSLEPVRGQINWFTPQPNARYGLFYRDVSVVSRTDGMVVQYVGSNDDYGFGDDSETPDREEMAGTLETLAPLFARRRG